MAWYVPLLITLALVIVGSILKKSQITWVKVLGEVAVYTAESWGNLNDLHGEEKKKYAIQFFREITKKIHVDWLTRYISDEALGKFIDGIVAKKNTTQEFKKQSGEKLQK